LFKHWCKNSVGIFVTPDDVVTRLITRPVVDGTGIIGKEVLDDNKFTVIDHLEVRFMWDQITSRLDSVTTKQRCGKNIPPDRIVVVKPEDVMIHIGGNQSVWFYTPRKALIDPMLNLIEDPYEFIVQYVRDLMDRRIK